MISNKSLVSCSLVLALVSLFGTANADPEIAGVIGLDPANAGSCIAVYIPMEESQALAGLAWYNNDASVTFPSVFIAGGSAGYPEPISEAATVAQDVAGASADWSELEFSQPIASASTGLYVVFALPDGSEYLHDGLGGGAAFGYTDGENGYTGWFSDDGQQWIMLKSSFGMAVQPTFVEAEEGMLVKSVPQGHVSVVAEALTGLLPASPNPFNPATEIRFAVGRPGVVDLAVYDIRGGLVKRLAQESFETGEHAVQWQGTDEDGRRVASGTYVVRFKANGISQSQRVVLVK